MPSRALILIAALLSSGVLAATAAATADHSDWPYVPIHNHDRFKMNVPPGIDDWVAKGTEKSDKLLGGHHDDTLYGNGDVDVLWGDYLSAGNGTRQHDVIYGGRGGDFIYGSHGRNDVYAGKGNDKIRIWFGRGFVDCGPGEDILYMSRMSDPTITRRHCEHISHLSDSQVHGHD